ncbi:hypothetical protein K432DRAFT_361636 [Lepidopterella palustris CBS 459.81]|uniref:COP9 signalosome complex subunit 6 n=1 Tax=Lepidopterella palustris CBS 459.81 TaxID=1314670 RepID=A0A8E2E200_9PEZI|nr:hypothetical protein K432DRAFT_361636 [Lepidopterella palustris CBS 459.81]
MAESPVNPLLSTARASDTSPIVQLHPLVLLTITDYITRHTLQQLKGPVVGAIIGQQNGQEITMEVAFEAKLLQNEAGEVILDDVWFDKRLEEYKNVHKSPALDLVGWFTLGPSTGPEAHLLPIHTRIQEVYNESPILLLFHPADAIAEVSAGGKLPLTLYESTHETSSGPQNDKAMDVDGVNQGKTLKFRELVYSVETGEAEMIAVDFVARGGGNATAVDGGKAAVPKTVPESPEEAKKGKSKAKDSGSKSEEGVIDESAFLTAEDEELLSSLTAKSNAIKMLHRRIALLRAYLATLPPSYLSDPSLPFTIPPTNTKTLPLNHPILRSISALLSRIPILAPSDALAFARESLEEQSDVQLVALLSSITSSVQAAKEAGRKHGIVDNARYQGKKGLMAGMLGQFDSQGNLSGGAFFDTIMSGGSGSNEGRVLRERQGNIERWG